MAIYIGDKLLKADPKGSKLERDYHEGLQKVGELFNKFRKKDGSISYIQIVRSKEGKVVSLNGKTKKRLPPIALPVELPYYDDEIGATMIRYSETPPTKNSNGGLSWGTKFIRFDETMSMSEKEKDKAWFYVILSRLTEKGVYKMVDRQAKYAGTFEDLMAQKKATDVLLSGDEELVRFIGVKLVSSSYELLDYKEVATKLNNWLDQDQNVKLKRCRQICELEEAYKRAEMRGKQKMASIEYDGEEVDMLVAPEGTARPALIRQAKELGIKITVPPQSADVLYSLVTHVKSKVQV